MAREPEPSRREPTPREPTRPEFKFSEAAVYRSDVGFVLDLSDDKKAFTATFSGLEVRVEPKSTTPVVTRDFSFSLPVKDAEPGSEIPFFVQGFVLCNKGTNAHLVFSVNDQSSVFDFPEGTDTSFLQHIKYKVGSGAELRVTVVLWADRDSRLEEGAHVNVSSIDTDVAKHGR